MSSWFNPNVNPQQVNAGGIWIAGFHHDGPQAQQPHHQQQQQPQPQQQQPQRRMTTPQGSQEMTVGSVAFRSPSSSSSSVTAAMAIMHTMPPGLSGEAGAAMPAFDGYYASQVPYSVPPHQQHNRHHHHHHHHHHHFVYPRPQNPVGPQPSPQPGRVPFTPGPHGENYVTNLAVFPAGAAPGTYSPSPVLSSSNLPGVSGPPHPHQQQPQSQPQSTSFGDRGAHGSTRPFSDAANVTTAGSAQATHPVSSTTSRAPPLTASGELPFPSAGLNQCQQTGQPPYPANVQPTPQHSQHQVVQLRRPQPQQGAPQHLQPSQMVNPQRQSQSAGGLPKQSSGLGPQKMSTDFTYLWSEVTQGCEQIFNWNTEPCTFYGQEAVCLVLRLYNIVYRLVSTRCENCPALVRTNNSDLVQGRDELSTQVMVLYYLIRELIKRRLQNVVQQKFAANVAWQMQGRVDVPVTEAGRPDPRTILTVYMEQWELYIVALSNLRTVFSYVHTYWSRFGLPGAHTVVPTETLGLSLWTDTIATPLGQIIGKQLIDLVIADRQGITNEYTPLIRPILQSLVMLNDMRHSVYADVFENLYLEKLEAHYRELAQKREAEGNVEAYLQYVLEVYADEEDRTCRLLPESSITSVRRVVVTTLIGDKKEFITQHVGKWFSNHEMDKLLLLLKVAWLSPTDGMQHMLEKYRTAVYDRVVSKLDTLAVESLAAPMPGGSVQGRDPGIVFIEEVLREYKENARIVDDHLAENSSLHDVVADAIRRVLCRTNVPVNSQRIAEYLARYIHVLLKNPKYISELLRVTKHANEAREKINDVVVLFRLIDDVNSFRQMYSVYQCQRLIFGSFNSELEQMMQNELCAARGGEFVHRWTLCLRDVTTSSATFQQEHQVYCMEARGAMRDEEAASVAEVDPMAMYRHPDAARADDDVAPMKCQWTLTPLILTSEAWTSLFTPGMGVKPLPLRPPSCLRGINEMLSCFYSASYMSRSLTFLPMFDSGLMRVNYSQFRSSSMESSLATEKRRATGPSDVGFFDVVISRSHLRLCEVMNVEHLTSWTFEDFCRLCVNGPAEAAPSETGPPFAPEGVELLHRSLFSFIRYRILLYQPSARRAVSTKGSADEAPSSPVVWWSQLPACFQPGDLFTLNPDCYDGRGYRRISFMGVLSHLYPSSSATVASRAGGMPEASEEMLGSPTLPGARGPVSRGTIADAHGDGRQAHSPTGPDRLTTAMRQSQTTYSSQRHSRTDVDEALGCESPLTPYSAPQSPRVDGRFPSIMQALIVRIMKKYGKLTLSELHEYVAADAVGGAVQPTVLEIKTHLDVALERRYVERDADVMDLFHYVP